MSDMIVAQGVPEVNLDNPTKGSSVEATFSGKWSDFDKDMAALAQEMAPQPAQPVQPTNDQPTQAPVTVAQPQTQAAPTQAQPATPAQTAQPTPTAVEIPEKFRAPDGTLDQEKVLKSYGEAERTLKRLQNQAGQPMAAQTQQPTAPQNQQPQAQAPLTPFELRVAQDIFSQGGFTEQQAVGLARVQVALEEARLRADTAATFSKVAQFEQTLEETNRRNELAALAKHQPWVLTPQGQAELIRVREENPSLNNSSEPWKAAVIHLLGQRALQGSSGPVNMPTPTGTQQQVPPLSAVPAQRVPTPVQLNTQAEVMAHVKSLSPDQEAEFWRKSGFKWEAPKTYRGL